LRTRTSSAEPCGKNGYPSSSTFIDSAVQVRKFDNAARSARRNDCYPHNTVIPEILSVAGQLVWQFADHFHPPIPGARIVFASLSRQIACVEPVAMPALNGKMAGGSESIRIIEATHCQVQTGCLAVGELEGQWCSTGRAEPSVGNRRRCIAIGLTCRPRQVGADNTF
jgi:hypothetical protein